jgi:hypothetical protein
MSRSQTIVSFLGLPASPKVGKNLTNYQLPITNLPLLTSETPTLLHSLPGLHQLRHHDRNWEEFLIER